MSKLIIDIPDHITIINQARINRFFMWLNDSTEREQDAVFYLLGLSKTNDNELVGMTNNKARLIDNYLEDNYKPLSIFINQLSLDYK